MAGRALSRVEFEFLTKMFYIKEHGMEGVRVGSLHMPVACSEGRGVLCANRSACLLALLYDTKILPYTISHPYPVVDRELHAGLRARAPVTLPFTHQPHAGAASNDQPHGPRVAVMSLGGPAIESGCRSIAGWFFIALFEMNWHG